MNSQETPMQGYTSNPALPMSLHYGVPHELNYGGHLGSEGANCASPSEPNFRGIGETKSSSGQNSEARDQNYGELYNCPETQCADIETETTVNNSGTEPKFNPEMKSYTELQFGTNRGQSEYPDMSYSSRATVKKPLSNGGQFLQPQAYNSTQNPPTLNSFQASPLTQSQQYNSTLTPTISLSQPQRQQSFNSPMNTNQPAQPFNSLNSPKNQPPSAASQQTSQAPSPMCEQRHSINQQFPAPNPPQYPLSQSKKAQTWLEQSVYVPPGPPQQQMFNPVQSDMYPVAPPSTQPQSFQPFQPAPAHPLQQSAQWDTIPTIQTPLGVSQWDQPTIHMPPMQQIPVQPAQFTQLPVQPSPQASGQTPVQTPIQTPPKPHHMVAIQPSSSAVQHWDASAIAPVQLMPVVHAVQPGQPVPTFMPHLFVPVQQQQQPQVQYVTNYRGEKLFFKKVLGQGNFGVVYLVQDFFDAEFVLKSLKPESGSRTELEKEWTKEISVLSALHHPNIISIYDYFVFNDLFYLVMERAHGSLRDYITKYKKMTTNDGIELARQILSALNYMHSQDVIHRDLHVDNVLYLEPEGSQQVQSGTTEDIFTYGKFQVKLADFGLSKVLSPGTHWAQTVHYGRDYDYSPELVINNGTILKVSDLYQLGLILYFCLKGEPALTFADGDPGQATISGKAQSRARALESRIAYDVAKLLSVNPQERHQNCKAIWESLIKHRT